MQFWTLIFGKHKTYYCLLRSLAILTCIPIKFHCKKEIKMINQNYAWPECDTGLAYKKLAPLGLSYFSLDLIYFSGATFHNLLRPKSLTLDKI